MRPAPEQAQRIARLTPVADVLARIDARVAPVRPRSVLADAGMTAAADLGAAKLPAQAIALRDGWAVSADMVGDAGPYAPVPLTRPEWVDQGTPLPHGTDAVLPADAVSQSAGIVQAVASLAPGDGVLAAGADAAPGVPLRKAGERLRTLDIAALRLAGLHQFAVHGPRITLVATDTGLHRGREETAWLINRLIGGEAEVARGETLEHVLANDRSDAIIAIGGTGQGRNDRSVATLARLGQLELHGMALSPGESAAFGMAGTRPVLLLPGRFDAALAVFLVVGRHLLARLAGRAPDSMRMTVRLARKVTSTVGMTELVPLRIEADGATPLASGVLPLQALTRADGYVLVPPESEGYQAGADVEMHPFP